MSNKSLFILIHTYLRDLNDISALGALLFNNYIYIFLSAGFISLVALIGCTAIVGGDENLPNSSNLVIKR